MALNDGALVTGRESHEIYLIEDGKRRWVPDLWTMQELGQTPADLQVVNDDDIEEVERGDSFESTVPTPTIEDGTIVESDLGVFRAVKGKLQLVANPSLLAAEEGWNADNQPDVTYLPGALIRPLIDFEEKANG
jgi:hypothetical protein